MKRFAHDKYGRGSAAANGEGFVDLAPGDTLAYSVANGVAFSVEAPRERLPLFAAEELQRTREV